MTENLPIPTPGDSGEFLLYQSEDGQTRIDVRMAHETVWLSQKGMADLFQTPKQNVSLHLQNIYEEGELPPGATVKKYLTVQTEGNRRVSREVDHYNLDAILAIGYRVRSLRGTQFRIWGTRIDDEPKAQASLLSFNTARNKVHRRLPTVTRYDTAR